ncbi:hypothetical protein D7Z54_08570 [Salibacterium salarium]|uniref:Uncharacterized protein n=2 Tax=Salibacterium salarium TaxID=284579 RepID=A0A428N657_9BACI|nr:hypothetical protein D7Z54_08570 [Salibacterium salarium]
MEIDRTIFVTAVAGRENNVEGGFQMLKAMKQKLNHKRIMLAEGTAQRIEDYAENQHREAFEKMKREETANHLLHQEIDKYLYTIHPSFLLNPDAAKVLQNRLLARSQGKFFFSFHVISEMRLATDFYNTDLSIFIRLLEKKGFQLTGNEDRFLTALLNKLSENNYRIYVDRYGYFVNENDTLQDAVYKYLEIADDKNKFESGRIDFLIKYLINKGLLSPDYTKKKMVKLIKSLEKRHSEDYKVTMLEKRMTEIG